MRESSTAIPPTVAEQIASDLLVEMVSWTLGSCVMMVPRTPLQDHVALIANGLDLKVVPQVTRHAQHQVAPLSMSSLPTSFLEPNAQETVLRLKFSELST